MMEQDAPLHPLSLMDPVERRPVCEDFSVVIPTLGRPILETCLCHLARGTHWPGQVIVVDQGRRPEAERMIARLNDIGVCARYVPSAQRGRSAGINRGMEQVRTRFAGITDDDCFVRGDWTHALSSRLRSEPGVIWTGRVESAGSEAAFSVVLGQSVQRHERPRFTVHPFIGGNVGMAIDVAALVGPFDEHPCVASAEDADYGHRALRKGATIAYDPDILLWHYHWRDDSQRAERYADYARSIGGFYGTHIRRGDPLILAEALRDLVRSPIRWFRGALRSDSEMIRNGRESTLNLLPGILAGLQRRGDRSRRDPRAGVTGA